MIDYCKLLDRPEVQFDLKGVIDFLAGKRILVTGAGGSIGSEICRILLDYDVAALIPVCKSEASLVNLLNTLQGFVVSPWIGDVTDAARMDFIFCGSTPDLVFHAAAHKHVPLMELNPGEAIKNNVFGTQVVAQTCARYGAQLVLISTDKAMNPTSVMGATKLLAEMCVQKASNGHDGFCSARLINVIGSSGSVLEIWQRQVEAGKPLTITHPDMTRYFMTVHEAATLLIKAASLSKGNERFVFDMDTPTRILDLAHRFVQMTNAREQRITSIGIRPGEKLHEDSPCSIAHHVISRGIRSTCLSHQEDILSRLNRVVNAPAEEAIAVLQSCLPTYQPVDTRTAACAV